MNSACTSISPVYFLETTEERSINMARFTQVMLLAFLVVAMVAPHEAFFHLYKHKHYYPKHHYVAKQYYHVAPVIHHPVYYRPMPVYKKKFYKKKFHG